MACVFTVGAAYFTRRLVEFWRPKAWQVSAASLLLFFSQTALLKDAFVTMTELPAAMFLAWSLHALFVEARPRKAALLAGFVPLCRVEMVPVVAVTALFCGFEEWRVRRDAKPWLRTLVTTTACGVPFLLLNVLVVYPKDWFGVPPGHGVEAINGRNYTSSAPVMVALLAIGVAFEQGSALLGIGTASVPSRALRVTTAVFAALPKRLQGSPPGTWVVLELNPKGELLPRYPQAIFDQIRGGELEVVVQFQSAPHSGFWGALDRISARNAAIGWRVFQRRSDVRP